MALFLTWSGGQEQKSEPAPSQPRYSYFSGEVTRIAEQVVTVRKAVLGHPAQLRDFLLDADTTIEGELRENARVTVAFLEKEDSNLARRIIVREATRPQSFRFPAPTP